MKSEMTELFLIRHGEAVGQGRYLGRGSDPSLSADGIARVSALKSFLPQPSESSSFFSSPMRRALETADILFHDTEGRAVINKIDEFSEIDFGEWDGLNWKEITMKAGDGYRAWLDDPVNLCPPEGETLTAFNSRINIGFQSVIEHSKQDRNEKIFIIAHGGVIRSILCSLLGLPAERHWSFQIDTASVSSVKLFTDPGARQSCLIEFLNLTAYR